VAIVRLNFNTFGSGEEYLYRLSQEANRNFKVFLTLLSSYWQSTIDGPNYAREIKAMSIELARIRLSLDSIRADTYYASTRADYLYQVLSSMLFPRKSEIPNPGLDDLDFRDFLQEIVRIYFQGSVPNSLKEAVEAVTEGQVVVNENFEEAKKPGSKFDISDQFGFTVDVFLDSPGDIDVFLADRNVRILLDIIRPAHTLYRLAFVLQEEYLGQSDDGTGQPNPDQPLKILDSVRWALSSYGYEDFRKLVEGVEGVDEFGTKKIKNITGEDHSASF
jgi:hypothetical protein